MKLLTRLLILLVVLIILGVADEEQCKKHEECPDKQYCCYSESKQKQYCSNCFGACRKDKDECCYAGGKVGTCQPHLPGETFCKADPWQSSTASSNGGKTTQSGDQTTKMETTTQVPEETTKMEPTTQVPEETTKKETKKPVTIPKPKQTTQVPEETTKMETTKMETTKSPVTVPEPTQPSGSVTQSPGSGERQTRCFIDNHCVIVGLTGNECRFEDINSAWGHCFDPNSATQSPGSDSEDQVPGSGNHPKRCFVDNHCTIVGLDGNECRFENINSAWGYCSKKN